MTLYRLYEQNDHRAGFWVQHRTWSNACARVETIAGRRSGRLPGASPGHEDAEIIIEIFDVRSGRRMHPATQCPLDRNYALIAEPWWSDRRALKESLHGL